MGLHVTVDPDGSLYAEALRDLEECLENVSPAGEEERIDYVERALVRIRRELAAVSPGVTDSVMAEVAS